MGAGFAPGELAQLAGLTAQALPHMLQIYDRMGLNYATTVAAQMVGATGMVGSLINYSAVQGSAMTDTNLVGRVIADSAGRAAVENLLAEQKQLAGIVDLRGYEQLKLQALRHCPPPAPPTG